MACIVHTRLRHAVCTGGTNLSPANCSASTRCSALTWAPAPRIYCDLLALTNHVRIADKAATLHSLGLPAATLPQRSAPRRLGASCVAVIGCSDMQRVFPNWCVYH